ncbi:hypothetical protein [Alkalibacillus haloalkaliphilus]|uniref:Lipoprotein n=1 Tax=Alkalibacillus haloalkaliphilus TaxID=94136 RepID=A0A511W4P1_9BACI|nr:hypothetical protein [Alkalibacillus haloalkaliphilus]GEN46076.1 hypothetical protein AHA02nite_18520 [Alkalibacillus haloalkaliphilus]
MKKWLMSILMISTLVIAACGGDVEEDPMPEEDPVEDPADEDGDMDNGDM